MDQQETAIAELEKELKELDTNMKLANSPGMKKQDQQNSKTLKNYMTNQDEYMRLVKKESEEIQCKFRSGVRGVPDIKQIFDFLAWFNKS